MRLGDAVMAEEGKKEFAAELKELGDKLVGLTLLQAKELADYLEDVHGIKAAAGAPVAMAMPADPNAAPAEEEKNDFDLVLVKVADQTKKIAVIKVVRELTGLGLKEAKEKVDKAPQTLKSGVPKDDVDEMKEKLEKAGAVVELK